MITGAKLWAWANKRAEAAIKADKHDVYPTMREAAKRFRCTLDDVEDATSDGTLEGDRYLGIGVAFGCNGGYYLIRPRGAQVVEAY